MLSELLFLSPKEMDELAETVPLSLNLNRRDFGLLPLDLDEEELADNRLLFIELLLWDCDCLGTTPLYTQRLARYIGDLYSDSVSLDDFACGTECFRRGL